jgi:pimeloyl-ACP methyl ester carboxylesterase
VLLPGLTFDHRCDGMRGWMLTGALGFLTHEHTIVAIQRRRHLGRGSSMADIAADYATALRGHFGRPMPVVGISTGGSVGLQLAADHPDVVERLLVLSSACRLGDEGRRLQLRLAQLAAGGDWSGVIGELVEFFQGRSPLLRWSLWPLLRLTVPIIARLARPDTPDEFIATIEAEDAFDLCSSLTRISAPTLVVGGARDPFYPPELFRRTAAGIPNGRLLLDPRAGHGSHRPAVRQRVMAFLAEPPAETALRA